MRAMAQKGLMMMMFTTNEHQACLLKPLNLESLVSQSF